MPVSNNKQAIHLQLQNHANEMVNTHLRDLFLHDADRVKKFSLELTDLFIDYSKNSITSEILTLLQHYMDTLDVTSSVDAMFKGRKINLTENQAVLHSALRSRSDEIISVDGINVVREVHAELEKIKWFTTSVLDSKRQGWTGKPLDTFVNIGTGGSSLGSKMAVRALENYRIGNTRSFFISNIDYEEITSLKKSVNPETTLFIISSKSFSTIETKTNANSLMNWMIESGCTEIHNHFVAVTADIEAAVRFGIKEENCFRMWDWVGGRFSLWSAIGIPIALAIGFDQFNALLSGAREMDKHFQQTPVKANAPMILGLLDYWYNNFLNTETHAFIPYDESLRYFPDFLSQLLMESNGKSYDKEGHAVNYNTMPISWGATGTHAQHTFFQLLHQGTRKVPIDFLVPLRKLGDQKHHALLFANCLAQSQALMEGEKNINGYQHFGGNRPSTTIVYSELNPKVLGKLVALYEHRTFIHGILWNLNSFDQWGVELGKRLASRIFKTLSWGEQYPQADPSTQVLINRYLDTH